MEAIEYLKLATDKTEAGDLIKENNLTEAVVKLMDNYAEFRVKNCSIPDVSGSLRFSEREVDFSYLCGVFNTSGIDGLHTEIQRLKELGKEPHDIIEACRNVNDR